MQLFLFLHDTNLSSTLSIFYKEFKKIKINKY